MAKGQLISKWFFGSSISSKKRTNKFDFTTMIPQVDLFSFRTVWDFFGSPVLKDPNWLGPLAHYLFTTKASWFFALLFVNFKRGSSAPCNTSTLVGNLHSDDKISPTEGILHYNNAAFIGWLNGHLLTIGDSFFYLLFKRKFSHKVKFMTNLRQIVLKVPKGITFF